MKKIDYLVLLRFLIICIIYITEYNLLGGTNLLLLSPTIFPVVLVIYLICILLTFFLEKSLKQKIKLITDIFFIIYFFIMMCTAIIIQYKDGGDEILISTCFFLILPLFVCFTFCFIRDIKNA